MTMDEVREATLRDRKLQRVMSAVCTGHWHDPLISQYFTFKDEISMYDGILLRGHRLIIPESLQTKVVHIAHQSHQGVVKTKQHIRERVWFPGIDKLVEDAVKSCIPCQASYPGPSCRDPIMPTPLPPEPWHSLAIDFAGPFPSGDYCLVVIDEYSRYPEVEIISSTSSTVTTQRLKTIFARQGLPHIIKTDNGPPFNGNEFAQFTKEHGIQHRKITPLWPEANGEAERFMRTLNKNIRALAAENKNLKNELSTFLLQYRATPHSTTQISPFEALTGRIMKSGIPKIPSKLVHNPHKYLHSQMLHNDSIHKQKMAEYADTRRNTKTSTIKPGDSVLVKQPKTNKLTPPYNPKPYTITEKKGTMLTAQRGSHRIVRNSSFFKPIPIQTHKEEEDTEDDEYEPDTPIDVLPQPPSRPVPTLQIHRPSAEPTPLPRRTERNRQMPQYLKDYVVNYTQRH